MHKTMQVVEYMQHRPFTLSPATPIGEAVDCLVERRLSGAPVLENGMLVGMFSESDALKGALDAGYHRTAPGRVADYMSREVHSLMATATVQEAAERFLRHHRRQMPVLDGCRLVGQLSRRDILRAALALAPEDGPSAI